MRTAIHRPTITVRSWDNRTTFYADDEPRAIVQRVRNPFPHGEPHYWFARLLDERSNVVHKSTWPRFTEARDHALRHTIGEREQRPSIGQPENR